MENRVVEAALDIHVPEVEPLVNPFRLQYDLSAAEGMPAHITINYPFLPGVNPRDGLYQELRDLFATIKTFTFELCHFARFPNVLYLAPEPETPFKKMIDKIAAHYPDSPPYGGVFEQIVPHLTIAHSEDDEILEMLERQLVRLSQGFFPLSVRAEQVWLSDNRMGKWQERKAFLLGRS
jgi:2'-5' RNA ligase